MAKSNAEFINHLGVVRLRVTGSGTLLTTAYSYGCSESHDLPDITLSAMGNRLPTVLANFKQQKMMLEIRTEAINEVFVISRLTPFVVPVEAEYPR